MTDEKSHNMRPLVLTGVICSFISVLVLALIYDATKPVDIAVQTSVDSIAPQPAQVVEAKANVKSPREPFTQDDSDTSTSSFEARQLQINNNVDESAKLLAEFEATINRLQKHKQENPELFAKVMQEQLEQDVEEKLQMLEVVEDAFKNRNPELWEKVRMDHPELFIEVKGDTRTEYIKNRIDQHEKRVKVLEEYVKQ